MLLAKRFRKYFTCAFQYTNHLLQKCSYRGNIYSDRIITNVGIRQDNNLLDILTAICQFYLLQSKSKVSAG